MGDLEPEVARRVLRKHHGDVQKAADAILEGDRGEGLGWPPPAEALPMRPETPLASQVEQIGHQASRSEVIDLTSDDDELSQAMKASTNPDNESKFGPSDRAPNPNWAIVPSNVRAFISAIDTNC